MHEVVNRNYTASCIEYEKLSKILLYSAKVLMNDDELIVGSIQEKY